MFFHRSSMLTLVSRHFNKTAVHDFNGKALFAVVLSGLAFNCGRWSWDFASNQTDIRDMLESPRLNSWASHDLGQVQWEIL